MGRESSPGRQCETQVTLHERKTGRRALRGYYRPREVPRRRWGVCQRMRQAAGSQLHRPGPVLHVSSTESPARVTSSAGGNCGRRDSGRWGGGRRVLVRQRPRGPCKARTAVERGTKGRETRAGQGTARRCGARLHEGITCLSCAYLHLHLCIFSLSSIQIGMAWFWTGIMAILEG